MEPTVVMAGWDIRLWPQASDRCLQSPHWGYTSIVHSVVAGTKYNKQYQISPRCKAQSWDKVDWWPAENRNTWILIFNRSFTLHEMTNHWTRGNPLTNTQSYVQQIFVAIKWCVDTMILRRYCRYWGFESHWSLRTPKSTDTEPLPRSWLQLSQHFW